MRKMELKHNVVVQPIQLCTIPENNFPHFTVTVIGKLYY